MILKGEDDSTSSLHDVGFIGRGYKVQMNIEPFMILLLK